MSGSGTQPLGKAIWERYSKVLGIKRRVYFLRAFQDELDRVTLGKPFNIRSHSVWNMALDARDKCVIDFSSLSVGMRHGVRPKDPKARVGMSKEGLFHRIRVHHAASFSPRYTPKEGE